MEKDWPPLLITANSLPQNVDVFTYHFILGILEQQQVFNSTQKILKVQNKHKCRLKFTTMLSIINLLKLSILMLRDYAWVYIK